MTMIRLPSVQERARRLIGDQLVPERVRRRASAMRGGTRSGWQGRVWARDLRVVARAEVLRADMGSSGAYECERGRASGPVVGDALLTRIFLGDFAGRISRVVFTEFLGWV